MLFGPEDAMTALVHHVFYHFLENLNFDWQNQNREAVRNLLKNIHFFKNTMYQRCFVTVQGFSMRLFASSHLNFFKIKLEPTSSKPQQQRLQNLLSEHFPYKVILILAIQLNLLQGNS